MNRILIGLSLFILSVSAYSQSTNKKAQKLFEKGMKQYKEREFLLAIETLEKSLLIDNKNEEANFQLGAYFYDKKNYKNAEKYLSASLKLNPKLLSKIGYQIGNSAHENENFEFSKQILTQFVNQPNGSESLKKKANTILEKLNFLLTFSSKEFTITPIPLPSNINSPNNENGPSLTAIGDQLVFTRETSFQEDLWIATKTNGHWDKVELMNNISTPQGNEGAQTISPDGKVIIFIACDRNDGYGGCDMYRSELKENGWTKPVNLDAPLNSKSRETQPTIYPDNKTVIFASNRAGGYGGLDLYSCTMNEDGSWQKPINLGDKINTPKDDRTPFIHPDGKTLYFSSAGHLGFGKQDLFISRLQKDGSWGEPTNLGPSLNTKGNEGSLIVSLDGSKGYFTSDQIKGAQKTDIFEFEMPQNIKPNPVTFVHATVKDAKTKQPISSEVDIFALNEQEKIATKKADSKGTFLVCLPKGNSYSLQVQQEGYSFASENFQLENDNDKITNYIEIFLEPIVEKPTVDSEPITLKNIFFDTGSAHLKDNSFADLQSLVKLLNDNPDTRIQINGHTDNVGKDEDNLILSQNRAQSVVDYLVRQKIAENRLIAKGYGSQKPIADNNTKAGRKLNRRTTFVILAQQ